LNLIQLSADIYEKLQKKGKIDKRTKKILLHFFAGLPDLFNLIKELEVEKDEEPITEGGGDRPSGT
jgi:hypothetical protein